MHRDAIIILNVGPMPSEESIREKFRAVRTRALMCFRTNVGCLNIAREKLTCYNFLLMLSNEEKRDIQTAKPKEIFNTLTSYCNYVDYSFLEYIIKEFGMIEVKKKMQEYIEELTQFEQNTNIHYRSASPHFPKHFIIVTITQDKDSTKCTLDDVRQFKNVLLEESHVEEYGILTSISKARSVVFALAFPPDEFAKIYQVFNVDFQKNHRIIKVTYSWEPPRMFYVCKSQIKGMYVYISPCSHTLSITNALYHYQAYSLIYCLSVWRSLFSLSRNAC